MVPCPSDPKPGGILLGAPFKTIFILGAMVVKLVQGVWSVAWPAPHPLASWLRRSASGKVGTEYARHPLPDDPTNCARSRPVAKLLGSF